MPSKYSAVPSARKELPCGIDGQPGDLELHLRHLVALDLVVHRPAVLLVQPKAGLVVDRQARQAGEPAAVRPVLRGDLGDLLLVIQRDDELIGVGSVDP